jgi:hypothetical protein
VPIRRSSAREVDELIARLGGPNDVDRDAAIARLRVIGARAVPHLLEAAAGASARTRLGALQALDSVSDTRTAGVLLSLTSHSDSMTAAAAAAALRPLTPTGHDARIIAALIDLVLDTRRDPRVRTAALRSLHGLGDDTLKPVLERLAQERPLDPELEAAAAGRRTASSPPSSIRDDPSETRRLLATMAASTSIGELHRVMTGIRSREEEEADPIRRREWMTARAVAHHRLAERGSRVAVYDLRDTIASAREPLPVEFLSAVERIGDAECAAALVSAYAAAAAKDWWTDHLAAAFRTIVRRERLTRRSAALQRAARKWPRAIEELFARAPKARTV